MLNSVLSRCVLWIAINRQFNNDACSSRQQPITQREKHERERHRRTESNSEREPNRIVYRTYSWGSTKCTVWRCSHSEWNSSSELMCVRRSFTIFRVIRYFQQNIWNPSNPVENNIVFEKVKIKVCYWFFSLNVEYFCEISVKPRQSFFGFCFGK